MPRTRLPLATFAALLALSAPAWAQRCPQHLTVPGGAAGDDFAFRVAAWGDTAVIGALGATVGANASQGAAYVFRRLPSGWASEATLTASDGEAFDNFGLDTAVWGDTAVVSANGADIASNVDQGAAYIFVRTPGGTDWVQQAKLTAADGHAGDNFGRAVAISGDTVVVGSLWDPVNGHPEQGSAYVFVRTPGGTGWTQQAKLTASDGAAFDAFGESVAVSDNTAVVGAWQHSVGPHFAQGGAYVFVRNGGAWTQQARLLSSDGGAGDIFGISVAVCGNSALVGAYHHSFAPGVGQGCAYVFTRTGPIWQETAQLEAPDRQSGDNMGYGVDIRGDVAVVGAYRGDVGGRSDQGAAYVFVRPPGEEFWTVQAKLIAPDGAANDLFGRSVALTGDTVFAGVGFDRVGENDQQGSAWVFTRFGENWTGPDFNGSGRVTVQDVFDFLAAWFDQSPSADFNTSGVVTVQDIFDFLAAWFAGCA